MSYQLTKKTKSHFGDSCGNSKEVFTTIKVVNIVKILNEYAAKKLRTSFIFVGSVLFLNSLVHDTKFCRQFRFYVLY